MDKVDCIIAGATRFRATTRPTSINSNSTGAGCRFQAKAAR